MQTCELDNTDLKLFSDLWHPNPHPVLQSPFSSDHKFSCIETVKYKFDSGTWYVGVTRWMSGTSWCLCPRPTHTANTCYTCRQPSPPDTSRPQSWDRLQRLQQQGGHQCVIRAVQLCHQLLTWLSSSRTPNPSALGRSKATSVTSTNPLTFNHGAV